MNRSALAVVAVLALALSACATPTPAPTSSPVAEAPASSPTPTPPPASVPEPIYEASCEDLAPWDQVDPVVGARLVSRHPLLIEEPRWEIGIDGHWTLRTAQATECLWTNGTSMRDEEGQPNPDYESLAVVALPNAQSAWKTYSGYYGSNTTRCVGEEPDYDSMYCEWNGLIDGTTWLNVWFEGFTGAGSDKKNAVRFDAIVTEITKNLTSAGKGESWSPSTDTVDVATTCPNVLSAEAVAAAVGVPASKVGFFDGPIGGTALAFEAEQMIDSDPCRWWGGDMVAEYGHPVQVLRGGEWAWKEARNDDSLGSNVASAISLKLSGLAPGDSAWARVTGDAPVVDLIIGGNWISLAITANDAPPANADEILHSLAQSIVDELRP